MIIKISRNYCTAKQDLIKSISDLGLKLVKIKDDEEAEVVITINKGNYEDGNWVYFDRKLNSNKKNNNRKTNFIIEIDKENISFVSMLERNSITEPLIISDIYELIQALKRKFYTVNPPKEHFSVLIKPTHRCNLDCKYCYDKPFRESIHNDMTIEIADKILALLSQYTEEVQWIWHGGEFTMVGIDWYKKFYEEVLPKYPMLDIDFHSMSNGINIDKNWIEFLKKYNIHLGVSYNAFYQTEMRCASQNNIALQSSKKNAAHIEDVLLYAKSKNFNIGVIDVITKMNSPKLIELYEYYKSIETNPCFNFVFHTGNTEKNKLEADAKEYTNDYLKYFKYWLYDTKGIYERTAVEFLSMVTGVQRVCCTNSDCRYKWMDVNPAGDIYPCDRYYPQEYCLGNIKDYDKLDDIFKSNGYQKYCSEIATRFNTYCENCGYFFACRGGCNGSALESSGDCSGVEKFYCKVFSFFFNGVYDIIRNIDWLNEPVNPNAIRIFAENLFMSVKDIKDYMTSKHIFFNLEYNPVDLVHCSEFMIFNKINQTNARTTGIVRHNNVDEICLPLTDVKKDFILKQREADLDRFLLEVAKKDYASKQQECS